MTDQVTGLTFADIENLPKHSPMRKAACKTLLRNCSKMLNEPEETKLMTELEGVDFSPLLVHYSTFRDSELFAEELIPLLFDLRDQLSVFYKEVKTVKQLTISELIEQCESSAGTEEFWSMYYFLHLHLKCNSSRFEEYFQDLNFSKRMLLVEATNVRMTATEMSGTDNVENMRSFGAYYSAEISTRIAAIKDLISGENPVGSLVEEVSSDNLNDLIGLVTKQRTYVNKIDPVSMFNAWIADRRAAVCFGEQNVAVALHWMERYFSQVSNEYLLLTAVDLATKKALNAVARGDAILAAMQDLAECKTLSEKMQIYVKEIQTIYDYTEERCKSIECS